MQKCFKLVFVDPLSTSISKYRLARTKICDIGDTYHKQHTSFIATNSSDRKSVLSTTARHLLQCRTQCPKAKSSSSQNLKSRIAKSHQRSHLLLPEEGGFGHAIWHCEDIKFQHSPAAWSQIQNPDIPYSEARWCPPCNRHTGKTCWGCCQQQDLIVTGILFTHLETAC